MKKLSFIYILVCVSFISNAQIQHEDFNANTLPNGWATVDSKSGYSWEFGYTGNLEGSGLQNPASFQSGGVIFNDNKYGDLKNNHVELISPSVNLTAKRIVTAEIEVTYNLQTFSNDGKFMIDVWDGEVWENVLTDTKDTKTTNSGENQTVLIDVTAYVNNDFKVKFVYDDENALTWGVGIDDYKLLGVAGSKVAGFEKVGFDYYPNPVVNNILTLLSSKKIGKVVVYNTLGQRVISIEPSVLESKLDMHNLAVGTYIVQVTVDKEVGVFKVVKQ